jgi:hypothetical protein
MSASIVEQVQNRYHICNVCGKDTNDLFNLSNIDPHYCSLECMKIYLVNKGLRCSRAKCTAYMIRGVKCDCGRHFYCSHRCKDIVEPCVRQVVVTCSGCNQKKKMDKKDVIICPSGKHCFCDISCISCSCWLNMPLSEQQKEL